jgi:uncharacterized OB-fold protein
MPDPIAPFISDNLLTLDGGTLHLLASCDKATGRLVFPPRPVDDERFDQVLLPRRGTLWSWTIQRFRPKSPPYQGPDAFEPFPVGYVELDGALIVEARLQGVEEADLAIGMPLELAPCAFTLANGETRTTFAFAPSSGAVT